MLSFLVGIGLGYIGYQTALVMTGYYLTKTDTLEELARRVLHWTYAMIAVVFGTWVVFGPSAEYVIAFAVAHAFSICLIDLETTFENN